MDGLPDIPETAAEHNFVTSWYWRALPAGMRRRWWMFRLFDMLVRHWPMIRRRRGLLVVRMDGIGDMVLFRRALDHYASAFDVEPSDITVLGCASWGPIADEVFGDYNVQIIDEHAFARQPFYRFKVGLWVRGLAPEVVVCDSFFRRAMMADSLVWMTGAPRTVVSLPYVNEPTRTEFTYYLSQFDEVVDTGVYPTHEIKRHFDFLSTVSGKTVSPELPHIEWRDQPHSVSQDGAYAVLNPGSNEYGRRWPFENYVKVAALLLEKGLRVVFVGGPGERAGDPSAQFEGDDRVIDLTGRTSLPELLDIMKGAALVISNDTGPAHLSIALGAPTVVVVGGGHFGSFVPYPASITPRHVRFVYEQMPCYHCFWRCHLRESRYEVFPCVSSVGFEQVSEAAIAVMAERDGQAV